MYEIEEYITAAGSSPFGEWILSLKDKRAQAKIRMKLARAELGNLGDWKKLKNAEGVFEMREHYGAGYRVYFSIINQKIVLLLAGSDKSEQNRTIKKAKEYLEDYERRLSS